MKEAASICRAVFIGLCEFFYDNELYVMYLLELSYYVKIMREKGQPVTCWYFFQNFTCKYNKEELFSQRYKCT